MQYKNSEILEIHTEFDVSSFHNIIYSVNDKIL